MIMDIVNINVKDLLIDPWVYTPFFKVYNGTVLKYYIIRPL